MIGNLGLFIPWLILFLMRKDTRKEMLIMSVLFGFIGFLVEPIFIVDWWHPLTITNTPIGIEDFLFGFALGGVAAVIYEEVMKKKLNPRRRHFKPRWPWFLVYAILISSLFYGSFFLFNIHSFWASLIAIMTVTILIWIQRPDLIFNSLLSGILLTIVASLFFILPQLITPGWVQTHWYMENLTGITILSGPLEDYLWCITAGLLVGPLYEFWQSEKEIPLKKRKNK
jgi:hypothetical protein